MTPEQWLEAWREMRPMLEAAWEKYSHRNYGDDDSEIQLSPWLFGDATEFEAAFDWIEAILAAPEQTGGA